MAVSIPELFELALGGDHDAVRRLHWTGERAVYEQARDWTLSDVLERQEIGLDVLGQLGIGQTQDREQWPFRRETIDLLRYVLRDAEAHPDVLQSAIVAAGHQHAEVLLDDVVAAADHPEAAVRYAVAWALVYLRKDSDYDGPTQAVVVATLIRLCADPDPGVREWAIFELRTIEPDQTPNESPDALAAYLAGAEDSDFEVRLEAEQALEALGVRSRSRTPRPARPTTSRRPRRRSRRRP